jgi:hypothetical protein
MVDNGTLLRTRMNIGDSHRSGIIGPAGMRGETPSGCGLDAPNQPMAAQPVIQFETKEG